MRTITAGTLLLYAALSSGCGDNPEVRQEASAPAELQAVQFAPSLGVSLDSMTLMPQGVRIRDVRAGTGSAVADGSTVRIEYKAWLPDGTLFEQRPSDDGFGASEFVVGSESAPVSGVSLGMVGMRSGGTRRILIPPEHGYGLVGRPSNVPAGSTLLFDVRLLDTR